MKSATKKKAVKRSNNSFTLNGNDPELNIGRLAKQGAIATAARRAIAASFKKGLSVTVMENGVIYRLHPDGKRTVIKKQKAGRKKYTTGKVVIR